MGFAKAQAECGQFLFLPIVVITIQPRSAGDGHALEPAINTTAWDYYIVASSLANPIFRQIHATCRLNPSFVGKASFSRYSPLAAPWVIRQGGLQATLCSFGSCSATHWGYRRKTSPKHNGHVDTHVVALSLSLGY